MMQAMQLFFVKYKISFLGVLIPFDTATNMKQHFQHVLPCFAERAPLALMETVESEPINILFNLTILLILHLWTACIMRQ